MARIRTIKPEFWTNEELASVSEHARLLAIALLNYCDDSGYFLANPALVRSACFPFDDDSSNIRRSLDELSAIGYIIIRECSGRSIGHVCTFTLHQRIDRPQPSRLEAAFNSGETNKTTTENSTKPHENLGFSKENNSFDEHSTNIRRTFDEHSTNVRRLVPAGTGNREQGKGTGKGNREREREHVTARSEKKLPTVPPETNYSFLLCNGSEWHLPQSKLDEYHQSFPHLDIDQELRKSAQWLRDNPRRRKTLSGICRFIGSWLAKAQDNESAQRGNPSTTFAEKRASNNQSVVERFTNERQ